MTEIPEADDPFGRRVEKPGQWTNNMSLGDAGVFIRLAAGIVGVGVIAKLQDGRNAFERDKTGRLMPRASADEIVEVTAVGSEEACIELILAVNEFNAKQERKAGRRGQR